MATKKYWEQVHVIAKKKGITATQARGLWRGAYAPSRSLSMKEHWRKSRVISKKYNIPIGEARRVASAVKKGARIMEHGAHVYNHEVIFITNDEEEPEHYMSVSSPVPLTKTEIKKRAMEAWDSHMGGYEQVGLVGIKMGERGVSPYRMLSKEEGKRAAALEREAIVAKKRDLARQKELKEIYK